MYLSRRYSGTVPVHAARLTGLVPPFAQHPVLSGHVWTSRPLDLWTSGLAASYPSILHFSREGIALLIGSVPVLRAYCAHTAYATYLLRARAAGATACAPGLKRARPACSSSRDPPYRTPPLSHCTFSGKPSGLLCSPSPSPFQLETCPPFHLRPDESLPMPTALSSP